jgi:hypothetical protein
MSRAAGASRFVFLDEMGQHSNTKYARRDYWPVGTRVSA